jgi:hypothetical protein
LADLGVPAAGCERPLLPMSERALLLLRDSCSGEDEGVTAFLIRDTVAGDVDALRTARADPGGTVLRQVSRGR